MGLRSEGLTRGKVQSERVGREVEEERWGPGLKVRAAAEAWGVRGTWQELQGTTGGSRGPRVRCESRVGEEGKKSGVGGVKEDGDIEGPVRESGVRISTE